MRYKRATGDNLDLGDRLVEKLAEQKHHMEAKIGNMTCVMKELNVLDASNNIDVQAMKRDIQKHHMEAKIGNMTCVMKELNVLDASNNIDVQAMKRDIQKYTMPSEWFKNKYE